MTRFIFLLSLLFSTALYGQMEFSLLNHDFGSLESYDHRFIDLSITNKGPKEAYILSIRKPAEVVFIQSKALIPKDSTIIVRFQVNPRQKGKFNYNIDIYTSDKETATTVKFSGNILSLDNNGSNSLTACPDFNSTPSKLLQKPFDYTVITIDATTKEVLSNAEVRLIQDGFQVWKQSTDKNGKITQKGTAGMSYFYAIYPGYLSSEQGAYLTAERNRVIVELTKNPNQAIAKNEIIKDEPTVNQPKVVSTSLTEIGIEVPLASEDQNGKWTINWPKKKVKEEIPLPNTPLISNIDFDSLPKDNFDNQYFKPINVAFVLDISSSMAQGNKMDLMKFSINELSVLIRSTDLISLVTYANNAKVILFPSNGMDKAAVQEQLKKLKASGFTAGSEGIKKGFEQVNKNLISEGVNHVFVLTDGAFNRDTEDVLKLVKKYAKKGISLSIVGIANQPKEEENMRKVAQAGNGEYIPVFTLEDASNNIPQMIRKTALKKIEK